MNEKEFKQALQQLANEAISEETTLWPAIRARFDQRHRALLQGEPLMQTSHSRLKWALPALVIIALAVAWFASPLGQVWAKSLYQFFTPAGADQLPLQDWQQTPAPQTEGPDPASILDASASVADVEAVAGFDVREPTWLPDSLQFSGASFEAEGAISRLFYRYDETNGLTLRQQAAQRTEDCQLCGAVGESAAIIAVQIGAEPGEYVEGVWSLTDDGPVWQSDPYLKTLRWQAGDAAFELVYMGPPESLSQADLIAIAESLK